MDPCNPSPQPPLLTRFYADCRIKGQVKAVTTPVREPFTGADRQPGQLPDDYPTIELMMGSAPGPCHSEMDPRNGPTLSI